ncbi:MAG: (d)CMP kinase [Bacteroidales bacterium]|nr:(d)CMP kinase [Bacteroidales bacterium]
MNKIIIAIDGHSSCGKSTFAKRIAQELGYLYVDSGAMYRAIALALLRRNAISNGHIDPDALAEVLASSQVGFAADPASGSHITTLNGEPVEHEIRSPQVAAVVSLVAAQPEVRTLLTAQQQALGEQKGIVMDGRDIGTAVFPNAELKIFMTAAPEVRAQRRLRELQQKGQQLSLDEVLASVLERDRIDQSRTHSPLRQAPDALLLDNSHLSVEQQMQWVRGIIAQRTAQTAAHP